MLKFLIKDASRRKWNRYRKSRARIRMIRQYCQEQESHLDDILRNVLKHIMPVTQPMVLISQVHHAGGSLLNRLFDGHPEIHAMPHEIGSGTSATGHWPGIDLEHKPRDWFETLFKEVDTTIIRKRFSCDDTECTAIAFVFLPLIQEQIFLRYLEFAETIQQRDVIDAYITSCFGAWLDYQNISGDKKFTTAYAPDLAAQAKGMEDFFEIYPGGRLISLVRNPEDWLASARTRQPDIYQNTRSTVNSWKDSARTVLEISRKFGDRVCLIRFEDLINRTSAVMDHLSKFLEIKFEEILLKPTFNSIPLRALEGNEPNNADAKMLFKSASQALDRDHLTMIKDMTQDDYQTVLRETLAFN